jgi:DDE superfamily endonuclease
MPCQLLDEMRNSSPIALGRPKRLDLGYERKGIANVHMAFEPLEGWREVEVSEHRRGPKYTHLMRHLVDELYPDAEKIRLVCDNLSTHTAAAFYEAFPPEVTRSLTKKIESCYTPVQGSWLNMVKVEISVLVRARACAAASPPLRLCGR